MMLDLRMMTTAVMLSLLGAAAALGNVAPSQINYQGRLLDDAGHPVQGAVTMIFTIYGSSDGSDIIWQETHSNVLVEDGLFNVALGEGDTPTPIEDEIFSSPERWLGIKIGVEPEITPRTRLVSVPYSQRVSTIDQADAGVLSGTLVVQSALDKEGLLEDARLIIRGDAGDSVIIDPGSDIGLKVTDDEGDEAVLITGSSDGGAVLITASDAAKASGQVLGSVRIAPSENVVLQAIDADDNDAVLITADSDGGTVLITASDAAKAGQIVRTVQISPSDNVVLRATEANQDDVVLITADETGGTVYITASDAAKANPDLVVGGVIINQDGIFLVNETDNDTTLAITAGGDIVGDGQLAMGENSSNNGDGSTVLGLNNSAGGNYSTVGGGQYNDVQSDYSSILGGYADTIFAGGDFSYLFGIGSMLSADSTFMVDMPHIRFGSEADGYEFPSADGTDGQILATDGAGVLNWMTPDFDGGGWESQGFAVYLENDSDSVGIGTNSPAEKLDVEGNIHASGVIASGNSITIDGLNEEIIADEQLAFRAEDGFYFADNSDGDGISGSRFINTSTGAYLSGDGIWTNAPNCEGAENLTSLDRQQLLDKLAAMPIMRWSSETQDGIQHIGPLPEDLYDLFGVGDSNSVSSLDPAGIALAAIQLLYQSLAAQQKQLDRIDELEVQVAEMSQIRAQLTQLTALVDQLSKAQQ